VNDFLNAAGGPNPTSTDDFFIGDIRDTSVDTATHIVEIVVFNAALTDAQIDGVNEFLLESVQVPIPEPSSLALAALGLPVIVRRRRRRG